MNMNYLERFFKPTMELYTDQVTSQFMATVYNPDTLSSRVIAAHAALQKAIESTRATDIDLAISHYETVAQQMPHVYPDYDSLLVSYAEVMLLRWKKTRQVEDIRKAVTSLEVASTKLGDNSPKNQCHCLIKLSAAYMDRYRIHRSDLEDSLRAAKCWEQAHAIAYGSNLVNTRVSTKDALFIRSSFA
jgi:hypothetical protein